MSKFLVSNTNFDLAMGVFYVSMTLLLATGAFIFGYVIKTSAPKAEQRPKAPVAVSDGAGPVVPGLPVH